MEFQGGGGAAVGSGDRSAVRIMASLVQSLSLSRAGLCLGFVSESQNHGPRGRLNKSPDKLPHFRDGQTEAQAWGVSCPRSHGY